MLTSRFLILVLAAGCSTMPKTAAPSAADDRKLTAAVDASALGWTVTLGSKCETVLVNPHGRAFNVGKTRYPDISKTHLYRLFVPELKAEFLVLHIDPVASGGSDLTVFTILPNDVPCRAADIHHHWEWQMVADWKQTLFVDSDGDGVLELRDWGAYRWSGTNTFYSFDGTRFRPLWIEKYKAADDDDYDLKLVSRRRVH